MTETIGLADGVPTSQSYEVFDDLRQQIDPKLKNYRELLDTDVEMFVSLLHELEVPEIDTEVRSE